MRLVPVYAPWAGRVHVAIAGARLTRPVRPEEAVASAKSKDVMALQVLDASAIASWRHLLHAAVLALKSRGEGRCIARSLSVELMLYVAGVRQIGEAIAKVGVKPSSSGAAIVCIDPDPSKASRAVEELVGELGGVLDDSVIEDVDSRRARLMELYSIGEGEVEASMAEGDTPSTALVKCVLSRVAMVDVEKGLASKQLDY